MNNYKYKVVFSIRFKKDLKKVLRQGKKIEELEKIIQKLANKEELEPRYRNHKLIDNKYYKNCNECHIRPDWLLIYQYNEEELLLLLMNTKSHSDLFNK